MPIFGKKDKQGNLACNFSHTDGVPGFPKGIPVSITQDDSENRIAIAKRLSKDIPVYLEYSQITAVDVISEKDVTEKNKSVIGRAAAGGILLGPLGAIVGGMSGTGKKQKTETKYYFVINYHPELAPEEIKVISFEIVGASLHWDNFLKALRSKIPSSPEKIDSQYL